MRWDSKSEQPFQEKCTALKRKERLKTPFEFLKIALGAPFFGVFWLMAVFSQKFFKPKITDVNSDFFGVNINPELMPNNLDLVNELGVKTVGMRFFLFKENQDLIHLAQDLHKKNINIIFTLIASKDQINSKEKLKIALDKAFGLLTKYSQNFIFALAINRYKWGYVTPKMYLQNLEVLENYRQDLNLNLIGSSVIDYEFLITIRTLFNGFKFKLSSLCALLYVDRRGDPTNCQNALNLLGKIAFLQHINRFCTKTLNKNLYINEFNWPLKDTYPYLPTSNNEAVSEHMQGVFLVKYYLLALVSGVKTCIWHQLAQPSFGLVNNLDNTKRFSFFALKFLIFSLENTRLESFSKTSKIYKFCFKKDNKTTEIIWGDIVLARQKKYKYYKINGEELQDETLNASYIIYKKEQ